MQRVAKEAMSRSTAVDGRVISSTAAAAPLLTRRNTRLVRGTSWERTLNRTSSLRRRKGDDVDDDALRFFLFCLCGIVLLSLLLRVVSAFVVVTYKHVLHPYVYRYLK
jgi:hypothetical protein